MYILLPTLLQEYKKLPKLHSIFNFTQLNTIEIIVICFIIPQIHLLLFFMMFENSFWKWTWLNGCVLH